MTTAAPATYRKDMRSEPLTTTSNLRLSGNVGVATIRAAARTQESGFHQLERANQLMQSGREDEAMTTLITLINHPESTLDQKLQAAEGLESMHRIDKAKDIYTAIASNPRSTDSQKAAANRGLARIAAARS